MNNVRPQLSVLAFCTLLASCAHPFLKAGGDLGSAIGKGVGAVSAVADSEADTYRTYLYLEPYRQTFGITDPNALDSQFVGLACRPHSRYLITERVALDNLNKFQAFLAANATDPKNPTLASLIADLVATGTNFNPVNPDKAEAELQAQRDKDLATCATDVRTTFTAKAQANILTVAIALAAWPKIQSFLVTLLTQADQAKRETKIIDSLKDPAVQASLLASIAALTNSVKPGAALASMVTSRKQMALWNAYFEYDWFKKNPAKPQLYGQAMEAATTMAAQLKIYDQLAATSLDDVMTKMSSALKKMQDAAASGKAPDESTLADVLSVLQFLSDASSKYNGAESAFHPASSSKK